MLFEMFVAFNAWYAGETLWGVPPQEYELPAPPSLEICAAWDWGETEVEVDSGRGEPFFPLVKEDVAPPTKEEIEKARLEKEEQVRKKKEKAAENAAKKEEKKRKRGEEEKENVAESDMQTQVERKKLNPTRKLRVLSRSD